MRPLKLNDKFISSLHLPLLDQNQKLCQQMPGQNPASPPPHPVKHTGQLRYLEFQGNGENTSSFPKFEIANYDVTRIHVHEQKCVHFHLNTLMSFRKICFATKRLYVCNPLCSTRTVLPTNIGVRLWIPTKLLDHFLNGILA